MLLLGPTSEGLGGDAAGAVRAKPLSGPFKKLGIESVVLGWDRFRTVKAGSGEGLGRALAPAGQVIRVVKGPGGGTEAVTVFRKSAKAPGARKGGA